MHLISNVNFSWFKFDSESFAPILNAITNNKCNLQSIKISLGSLTQLDIHTCKMLSNLFKNQNIQIVAWRLTNAIWQLNHYLKLLTVIIMVILIDMKL